MRKKGFTLIELIITIAIFGVVLSSAGGFMPFGFKINKKANTAYDLQSSVRFVSSRINDICRNRQNATLLSSMPASKGSYKYIYMKSGDTNTIYYYDGSTESTINQITGGTFAISFSSSGTVLNYTISAYVGSNSYHISSGVEFVNMKTSITGSSGNIIRMDL